MVQFYFYDLDCKSELAHVSQSNAKYAYMPYLNDYWIDDVRLPYLIIYDNQPAGFALVHNMTVNEDIDWKLAEYFVMGPFRRKGVASKAFKALRDKHAGTWELAVLTDNNRALSFWKNELSECSKQVTHTTHPEYIFYEVHANS